MYSQGKALPLHNCKFAIEINVKKVMRTKNQISCVKASITNEVNFLSKPLVSICCTTYNHENYIRQCLNGFVMQQSTFSYEILVHDDASTDNTAKIVKEYEAQYPHLFRCVYQTENQFGKQDVLINILFPMLQGKYIAICEGDDYWTDPYKLQKQVDFLEANDDYAGCSHNTRIIYEDSEKGDTLVVNTTGKDSYTIDDITKGYIYFHTSSMVYRNIFKGNFPKKYMTDYFGDWFLLMAHADIGPIKYIDKIMSVYRLHANGVWSKMSPIQQIVKNLTALIIFNKAFEYKYEENFLSLFTRNFSSICREKDYEFYKNFFKNIENTDLIKIIFYAYKDNQEKDKHDIVTRLRATWLGHFYTNHLKQYALVQGGVKWIRRNVYLFYEKHWRKN